MLARFPILYDGEPFYKGLKTIGKQICNYFKVVYSTFNNFKKIMLLTELPMYLYHNTEIPKRGDGALFHFTSFKSFLKILNDLTLKPSSFDKLNDLNEGNIGNMNMDENFMVMYGADKYIKKKCHLLCFTQNYNIHGICQEGTNHPAMWAHYADNSNGVCIVIDKKAFIKKNKPILNSHFNKFKNVKYSYFNTPNDNYINKRAKTAQDFIKNNWEALFFLKHKDWEKEDEHRLFIMDFHGKLSIEGCIKYIVLGWNLYSDEKRVKKIMDRIVEPNSGCFQKLIPHSFATTNYNNSGYVTFEIPGHIVNIIRKNLSDERYANYRKWLLEERGYLQI